MRNNVYYYLLIAIVLPLTSFGQNCMSNFSISTECIDASQFIATIEFDHNLENGDMIMVFDLNGISYGNFDPSQQPIILEISLPDPTMNELSFIFLSIEDTDCNVLTPTVLAACDECNLEATNIQTECDATGESYLTTMELINRGSVEGARYIVTHTASGQFIGMYSHLGTGQSRTISFNSPLHRQGNFTIEIEDSACSTNANIATECSNESCSISNIVLQTQCVDEVNFTVDIEFDYNAIPGNMVSIKDTKGNDYGLFNATQQPIQVSIQLSSTNNNQVGYIVQAAQDSGCVGESSIRAISCNNCQLEAEILETICDAEVENYLLKMEIINNGITDAAQYSITYAPTGQTLGMFTHLGSSPSRIVQLNVPSLLQGEFSIALIGSECAITKNVQADCPSSNQCEFVSIEVTATPCNTDGTYNLLANFIANNTSDNIVSVKVNNGNSEMFSNTGRVSIINISPRDNTDFDLIEICSNGDPDCCMSLEYRHPICIPDKEVCSMDEAHATIQCLDDGKFNASITFTYEASHQDGVSITGNGVDYGTYDGFSQPIIIEGLESKDNEIWEFVITDNQDEACQTAIQLGNIVCEQDPVRCTISNIEISEIFCSSNEEYEMSLNFDLDSTDDLPFSCFVNGILLLNSTTAELPLKMEGMSSAGSNLMDRITICMDDMDEDCCLELEYEKPNCLSNSIIDNSLLLGVTISPNPANNQLNINAIPDQVVGLKIVDNLGRTVMVLNRQLDVKLDISTFQVGMYTIQFFTEDNRVMSERFIKL